MEQYSKPLDQEGWSEHYNMESLNNVVNTIVTGNVQVWAKELMKICRDGNAILEIGCGTGISSLWLAKNGKNVTALDYTASSVNLVEAAAKKMALANVKVVQADATQSLPFEKRQFDYIFQAGLLEHFEKDEQISLLKNWKTYGKYMISMIPNSASIPYRVGKDIMEKTGTWSYGRETPKASFAEEFLAAGITEIREYTIGTEWALSFLPPKHYIRKFYAKLLKDGYVLDNYMQGYLLVTIGKC